MENHIQVLNVAGPRASKEPQVYGFVKEVLASVLAQVQEPAPVRVLFSETDKMLADALKASVEHVSQRAVTMLAPPGIHERDLLGLAAAEKWDFAILFANNERYESGDRSPEGLERAAAGLVRRLVQDFRQPVMVLYTFPDLDSLPFHLKADGSEPSDRCYPG